MHERQRALAALVAQVGVELGQLEADQHALVVEGARGARGDIQPLALRGLSSHTRRITYSLRSNASWSPACSGPAPTNSWRISGRHAPATSPVCSGRTGTSRQPSTVWPSARHGPLEQLLQLLAARALGGQEAHQHPVAPGRWQLELDDAAQQLVGHLHQDPRAVARARIRARGAAVLEVLQRRDPALHDLVRGRVVQARDHAHAARVVLEAGVVETDGLGRLHGVRSHGSAPWGRCSLHEHSSRGHGRTPEAEPKGYQCVGCLDGRSRMLSV